MGASLLHQCSTNIASLITARFVSLEAMGMFSRAQSVTAMFDRLLMSGVGPLLLPHLAEQRRGGHDAAKSFWQAFGYLSALTWPFFLFVSLYATPIVHVLFGDQWLPAAELLRLIALGGPFWLIGCLVPPLLTALGHVGLILRVQVVAQLVAVIGVGLAAPHGVGAVALAAIPISGAHGLIWLWVLRRLSPDALGPMWERLRSAAHGHVGCIGDAGAADGRRIRRDGRRRACAGLGRRGGRMAGGHLSSPATRCLGSCSGSSIQHTWCRGCCHVAWRG